MSENLKFRYDVDRDVMTIEGLRFEGEFFRQFGHVMPVETPLKIIAREDGVLTVVQIEPGDPDWHGGGQSIPPGHRAILIPDDAPGDVVAEQLRNLADRLDADSGEAPDVPRIIMPPGHA